MIEWVNHNHHIRNSDLKAIMNNIVEVKSHFHDISFTCEYREFNTKVDNIQNPYYKGRGFYIDEVDFRVKRLVKGKAKDSLIYRSVHSLTPTRFQLMTT